MNIEKEIERLNSIINNSKKKLEKIEKNKTTLAYSSIFIFAIETLLFTSLIQILPIEETIIATLLSYFAIKLPLTIMFGTRIGKKIKQKKLNKIVTKSEIEKEELTKELINQKQNTKKAPTKNYNTQNIISRRKRKIKVLYPYNK